MGWQTRWAALGLVAYLMPMTLCFHYFWDLRGPAQMDQMVHFLKNLAIMGGLLEYVAMGAGVYSLDALRGRPRMTLPAASGSVQRPAT